MMSSPPASAPQRTAIIDLGSNTARLVVMRFVPGFSYHLEDEIREIVRLREGMTEQGLSEAAMMRGLFTLRLFKRFCDSIQVSQIIATATSAVREAANGAEFLRRVEEEVGLSLRLLNGEEEARFGVLGALNAVDLHDGAVIDIGGGSAQLSQVRERRFARGQALTLGALALTERFVQSDPIKKKEIKAVEAEIARQLDEVSWLQNERGHLVGLGGTIRNLAKIEAARLDFPLPNINGFHLQRAALDTTINELIQLPLEKRRRISGLARDRADIILPGALVLRAAMQRLDVSELAISEYGLREGLFFEHFRRDLPGHVASDLRLFAVLNLARFYDFQEAHASHVRHLTQRLFDQLASLHGYGAPERELLSAAALLHDIGMAIKYNDHHKYSQTLISSSALPGFSPREVAIIALLARYHRKGTPKSGDYESLLDEGDDLRLLKLSALLRLAEYLERGRAALVKDISVRWDDKNLYLTLISHEHPAVELWEASRNGADLMEPAFGRTVVLDSHMVD